MTNQAQIKNVKGATKYDLEERTAKFSEDTIDFVRVLPRTDTNIILIRQLIRSSTSIGANYVEADAAESKKDFKHKIAICKKESKESRHWLRMIARANPDKRENCIKLWREAKELVMIFSSILKK